MNAGGEVLVGVRDSALSLDEVVGAVTHPRVGAVVTFTGVVRDHDGGREVERLDYSAHPSAEAVLGHLAGDLVGRPGVVAVAALHRTGRLQVGDLAVVLAVGAEHRAEAFGVCREFIDRLKASVPIWKHQVFGDGDEEWVGTP